MDEKFAKRGRGRKLQWRLQEILKHLATQPLTTKEIVEKFAAEWKTTPRTIERYIRYAREDAALDVQARAPHMAGEMEATLKALLRVAVSKGRIDAAVKCAGKLMDLYGLGARRVEVTGKDGKPLEIAREVFDLSGLSDSELDVLDRALGALGKRSDEDAQPQKH